MKKNLLYLFLLISTLGANAQSLTQSWQVLADGPLTWFQGTTGQAQTNNCTSLDYNPVTDRLLVANRNDRIVIINPATGASEGTLSTTGLGTESFKFNKIRVTSDGVIYGISLSLGAGTARIYRWASQTASPTLAATFTVTERCGDAFGLSGTGSNTILYAAGSAMAASPAPANSYNIYVLNTPDGSSFALNKTINIATAATSGQWANRAIEPVTNDLNSDLWIKGGGMPARKITISGTTATVAYTSIDGTGTGQIGNGFGGMRYIKASPSNKEYLALAGGNNVNAGTKVRLIEMTSLTAPYVRGEDSLYAIGSFKANANGTGDAAFKLNTDGTTTVFWLGTNNGFAASVTATSLPVQFASFTANVANGFPQLQWSTSNELNNKHFVIQSSLNGTQFANVGTVASKAANGTSTAANNYQFTDARKLKGKIFYRLQQVDKDGSISYSSTVSVVLTSKAIAVQLVNNPVQQTLQAIITTNEAKKLQWQLFNNTGKLMASNVLQAQQGDNSLVLPMGAYTAGMYYLNIIDDKGQVLEKALPVLKQ
ncbi:MAG: T9SS C-terminal target domain-containing protein [Bacteroidetes bacterium]|nr:MAG: T9SS C-terminal target domain-containing protein [Bacteroidota bacterium]